MSEESLSPWAKYKKSLGDTRPWDIINPNKPKLDDKSAAERFDICLSCEHLIKLTNQCKKCGCLMSLKTKLKEAACPLQKW
jgi:hypothetical protein